MHKFLINDFEGPLDLLLHLIKNSKMEISEVRISEITEQYIKFIRDMEELNLDIASEYLVMAAELMEIKSRSLLPKKETEESEEEEELNPEEELKRRLLEYQMYKESALEFRRLEENRTNVFTRLPESVETISDEHYINDGDITIDDLMAALKNILDRKEYSKPINTKVTKKELSVSERMVRIRDILKSKKKVSFVSLFENVTRPYVVVTFLSILEMAKNKELIISQDANFGEIYIEGREIK